MTPEERADGVEEFPVDDSTREALARYRQGDAQAGETLRSSLQSANQQTATVVADSIRRGQPNAAPVTNAPGSGKVGILQTPANLNANLNVAETALNTADAFEKLRIEEQGVLQAANEAGLGDIFTPSYFQNLYATPAAGVNGPFPADPQAIQTRLNSAQANDPDYINYINRIGGITAAAEINRRQNVLAEAKQRIAGAATQKGRLKESDDIARALREMEEDRTRDITDITMSSRDAQRDLDKYERDYQVKRERLENALWRAAADADPARAVAMFEGMSAPRSGNALFGTGEVRTTPPPTTSKGPPGLAEGVNPAAAYGTRNRFGELVYPGREQGIFTNQGPATPAPPTPAIPPAPTTPEKPPYAAPPGQRWVNRMGRWELEETKEYEQEAPAFEEGGYYDSGGFTGSGGDYYGYTPPPAAAEPPAAPGGPSAPPPPGTPVTGPPEGETVNAEQGQDPGTTTPFTEEPLVEQPNSEEEYAIAQQIGAITMRARQEVQEFNMARERLAQQAQLLKQSEAQRIADAQSRGSDAMGRFQARLLQLDTQMRQAIAQNPFAARQLRAIVRPDVLGLPGPLQTPGGRFDAMRQNITQTEPVV